MLVPICVLSIINLSRLFHFWCVIRIHERTERRISAAPNRLWPEVRHERDHNPLTAGNQPEKPRGSGSDCKRIVMAFYSPLYVRLILTRRGR